MSQRESGYARIEHDNYETPQWVARALLPHLPEPPPRIWECAAGTGQMASALISAGYDVISTDITTGQDFLTCDPVQCGAIVTNPPYALAQEFIEHALELTKPLAGMVAMLLAL